MVRKYRRRSMGEFPKDGSTFIVESIDSTAYRWAKYKTAGARQMGKPGRWQKQVWSGDWFKWENCEEPVGEIAPAMEDGPISGAVKALAAKDAEIARLRRELKVFLDFQEEIMEAIPSSLKRTLEHAFATSSAALKATDK